MNKTVFVGIDPGKSGNVCILYPSKKLEMYETPVNDKQYDIPRMYAILKGIKEVSKDCGLYLVMERSTAMPGQGSVSMFSFGMGFGIWLGLINALEISYALVHPRTWTKYMLEGAPGEGKDRAFSVARRLFPEWKPRVSRKGDIPKVEKEKADAILLADYARRSYK
jgi:crossover junction endodeoxyribonuclease RuvC